MSAHYVVVGAGAIGGVVGGRLALAGHAVSLVARGDHGRSMRSHGLTIESPDGPEHVDVPAAERVGEIPATDDDVILLAVKSQDTDGALAEILATRSPRVPIVCLQNGVDNERKALRCFEHVLGALVICPGTFLEPGVVQVHAGPVAGIIDVGAFPAGVDETSRVLVEALRDATFDSIARPDVMRWKYAKLLTNLANAADALCGPDPAMGEIVSILVAEAHAVLDAAGIPYASSDEDRARRGSLQLRPIGGGRRPGGSTWQSLQRGVGSVETDYLNGEISLLGRLHGVPTPANALMQRLVAEAATQRALPGSMPASDLLARLSE